MSRVAGRGPAVTDRTRPAAAEKILVEVRRAGDAQQSARAVALARRGLALLGAEPASPTLRALLMINLASNVAQLSQFDESLEILDRAAAVDPSQMAAINSARGLIYAEARFFRKALQALDLAIAGEPSLPPKMLCGALVRRGNVQMALGRLDLATEDLSAANEIALHNDLPVLAFYAGHNLAWVRFLQGDLPGSLEAMQTAKSVQRDLPEGIIFLDRARVLLAAGMVGESRESVQTAIALFADQRALTDLADAHLAMAEIDMLEGDFGAARKHAESARSFSHRRGLANVALVAELTSMLARFELDPRGTPRKWATRAASAQQLADALLQNGLRDDAGAGYLLQAQAFLNGGRPDLAQGAADRSGQVLRHPNLAGRLHTRLIQGRIEFAAGRPAKGLAQLRIGLDDLADFQARFGSQDMQSGASVHGALLARTGLRAAVDTGSPARILAWLERSRAVSTRLPVVKPPADPELAQALSALRFATDGAREAALSGRTDPALDRTVLELRKHVRSRSWIVAGSGAVQRPLTLTAVQRLLAADPTDPTLVAYITGLGKIRALVITARHAHFQVLGDWADESGNHRRRAADLDMLAAAKVPAAVRAVALKSVNAEFARLSDQLLDPIADRFTSGPLIVAGVGELSTMPWTVLPALAGRPVSVSPSVTVAMASGGRPGRAHLRGVLAVAGPDVPEGPKEATEVAALYQGSGLLTEESATGEAVLAQIPAGGLLHIAAHGRHEHESPLFSCVQLTDGPLYAYDIAPNPRLPDQVVLSSCDVGRSSVRTGGEPLGLAAALMRSGVATVIAGVSRVSDAVAAQVMVSYHRELLGGHGPAAALAVAVGTVDGELAPFNCFGSGL